MQEVAEKTGLSEAQVYKWGWDQKRKKLEGDEQLPVPLRKPSQDIEVIGCRRKQKSVYKEQQRAHYRARFS